MADWRASTPAEMPRRKAVRLWREERTCLMLVSLDWIGLDSLLGYAIVGLDLKGRGGFRDRTRLLCWTASGTRGLISRESSCFVGAIWGSLMPCAWCSFLMGACAFQVMWCLLFDKG